MDELKQQSKKKPVLIIAFIIVAIAVLAAGGYYLFKLKTKNNNSSASSSKTVSSASWPKSDSPWPMFHGNYNHTGYADISGPATNQLKWKYQIGGKEGIGANSVTISKDGTVFVAGNNKITALNADGSLKWVQEYISTQGPGLSADGTTLYFDSDKSLIAISALDGSKKWEFKSGNTMVFGPTIGPDGVIYQGSWDKFFYAINSDGTQRWKYETKGTISYPPSIDKNGNIYLGGGDAHFGPDGNIYAFDKDGKSLWTYDTKMLRVGSPAIGYDGLLYFAASPDLFVLSTDGKLVWKKGPEAIVTTVQSVTSSVTPGATSNEAPAACPPPPAPCSNATSGAAQGEPQGGAQGVAQGGSQAGAQAGVQTGAQGGPQGMEISPDAEVIAGIITPALTPDGLIYIGNPQGKFMAIDAKTQEIKWSYQTGRNPDPKGIDFGLPSFVLADKDGTSYFGAFDHKFYAIDKNGKLKWDFETGDRITEASPAIGADGTIYFTSEDGYLYAIGK
ncbi:MAG: PQQ-binding-like beta-propeller repeat protein [Candidatus Berkelbacteria bacterium]|nr:PQQ-binding-like beta-propeller repeat protein [Candidatus Berkelbacteria bacterium]